MIHGATGNWQYNGGKCKEAVGNLFIPTVPPAIRSPLNEDVFTMPEGNENRVTTPDVVQFSEQIHRILVQPVHNGGSQGYSSLGSSGSRGSRRSHQQRLSASAASSSDSNGPAMDEVAAIALHKPVNNYRLHLGHLYL